MPYPSSQRSHHSPTVVRACRGATWRYEVQIDAWLAPLSRLSSIGVDAARMVREMSTWHADARVTVAVEGREPIAVPLFGEYASGYRRERCETFLHELRSRLVQAQSENRPRSS